MVPEKQWRDKGEMMDKRTARKVHGSDFRRVIDQLRRDLLGSGGGRSTNQDDEEELDGDRRGRHLVQVCVRKRPMLPHEAKKREFDVVTCVGGRSVVVHDCQMYADMKRKFIESHAHVFSKCFAEDATTGDVYDHVAQPLVAHALDGGKSVLMMYGQTGSGKTYTMSGLQEAMAHMLFAVPGMSATVSAVEIAGAKCCDLLRRRIKVIVCDDASGNSQLLNVSERTVASAPALLDTIHDALDQRATEATAVNAVSSRSHFLCRVQLASGGSLTLLDLAGSERNEDSFHHSAERRRETSEINASHLALKQCVLALGGHAGEKRTDDETSAAFVPYRASTLTRLLKDSLWAKGARAAIVATISPLATDTEHTLHTLEYASRMLAEAPGVRKQKVDVATAPDENKAKAIKDWTTSDVSEWWHGLKKGLYAKYAANAKAVDGKMLLRLGLPRVIQLCNNNAIDGDALFKLLQKEKARDDKADKERRARNLVQRKK
ncbi:Aste57867_9786 [Aphanomyces stellatus]|uniref:Aste57867_9786 protein n=1 Tax=Aphanomyces stellatus TaxID=120398 RepID=A0A485KP07_9STRA|nr:hypothetical protein As57867_009747 [Aphanomyces stellatus]VFT86665.1 Aste57867_9786 [Aphanomyces stellatus]